MPEFLFSGYRGYSECLTGNTNDLSRRSFNFLCRRKCNTHFQCWYYLFMVHRCNNSKYQPGHFGKLYSSGYQCSGMPEFLFSGYRGYSECLTGNTNDLSRRSFNFLSRRKCNTYFECWYYLFMVYRCNNSKYQPGHFGKLYGSGNQCSRMPEFLFSGYRGYSECLTGNTNY